MRLKVVDDRHRIEDLEEQEEAFKCAFQIAFESVMNVAFHIASHLFKPVHTPGTCQPDYVTMGPILAGPARSGAL
jgi:hypothetical protein